MADNKKRILVFAGLSLLLLAFQPFEEGRIPKNLRIKLHFSPYIDCSVDVELYKKGDLGYLSFKSCDYDSSNHTRVSKKIDLSTSDFENFYKILGNTSLLKLPNDTTDIGLHGMTMDGNIWQDGKIHRYWSWSPRRKDKPSEYNFLDALFSLLNEKLSENENYIENVQRFLDYGLTAKIKSEHPFIGRIYGQFSPSRYADLQAFFDRAPKNEQIIMDISNFISGHEFFYNKFNSFDSTHSVIWITSSYRKKFLKNAGIDTMKMADDLPQAMDRLNSKK